MRNVSQPFIRSQDGLVPSKPSDPVTQGRSSGSTALPSKRLGDAGLQLLRDGDHFVGGAECAGADQDGDLLAGVEHGGGLAQQSRSAVAPGRHSRRRYGWCHGPSAGLRRQFLQIVRKNDAGDRARVEAMRTARSIR